MNFDYSEYILIIGAYVYVSSKMHTGNQMTSSNVCLLKNEAQTQVHVGLKSNAMPDFDLNLKFNRGCLIEFHCKGFHEGPC